MARRKSNLLPLSRQSQVSHPSERRDLLSPLAVIKRCIRYEPAVFDNRSRQVLEMAALLNHPDNRVIMMAGKQGSGKTSLARGVVELMGGGPEQALWFDVHRYTDAQELIHFLVEYVQYIHPEASAENLPLGGTSGIDSLGWLDWILEHLQPVPLLLVIDNVEHLVNEHYQLRSHSLKQALNALVTLPQIRLILLGEALPLADINVQPPVVQMFQVAGLEPQDWVSLMQRLDQVGLLDPIHADKQIDLLYNDAMGSPWLLRTLNLWLKHFPELAKALLEKVFQASGHPVESDASESFDTPLLRQIVHALPNHLQQVAGPMALMRHPVNAQALRTIMSACFPTLAQQSRFNVHTSPLRPLMKKTYPPQLVLEALQRQQEVPSGLTAAKPTFETIEPWFEFYQPVKGILQPQLTEALRGNIHSVLQQFYFKQKSVSRDQRQLPLASRVLLTEASFHGQFARQLSLPSNDVVMGLEAMAGDLEFHPYAAESNALVASAHRRYTLDDFRQLSVPDNDDDEPTEPSGFRKVLAKAAGLPEPVVDSAPHQVIIEESHPPPLEPLPELTSEVLSQPSGLWQQLTQAIATQNHAQQATCWLAIAKQQLSSETSAPSLQDAEKYLNHALALKEHMSPLQQGQVLATRGGLYQQTYRDTEALKDLEQATEILQSRLKQPEPIPESQRQAAEESLVDSLVAMGEIYQYRELWSQAQQSFQQAIETITTISDVPWGQPLSTRSSSNMDSQNRLPDVHYKLAGLCLAGIDKGTPGTQKAILDAKAHYQAAFDLDVSANNIQGASLTAMRLGELALVQDEMKEAAFQFKQAKQLSQQAGYTEGIVHSLLRQADIALSQRGQNAFTLGIQLYQQALTIAVTEEQPAWKSSIYAKLGNVYRESGDFSKATQAYQAAIDSGAGVLSQASFEDLEQRLQSSQTQV